MALSEKLKTAGKTKIKVVGAAPGLAATNLQVCAISFVVCVLCAVPRLAAHSPGIFPCVTFMNDSCHTYEKLVIRIKKELCHAFE